MKANPPSKIVTQSPSRPQTKILHPHFGIDVTGVEERHPKFLLGAGSWVGLLRRHFRASRKDTSLRARERVGSVWA